MGEGDGGVDEVGEAGGGDCIAEGDALFAAEIALGGIGEVCKIDDRKGQVAR